MKYLQQILENTGTPFWAGKLIFLTDILKKALLSHSLFFPYLYQLRFEPFATKWVLFVLAHFYIVCA